MNLISQDFFIFFLPIALFFYWKLLKRKKTRLWGLLFISIAFYLFADAWFIPLLLGASATTITLAKKGLYRWGIAFNLILLLLFKYFFFGPYSLDLIHRYFGFDYVAPFMVNALPLGISYYTFKHISFLVDQRNNPNPASISILSFLTYSTFFPQISAGPIARYSEMEPQFQNLPEKAVSNQTFEGLVFISIGLAKKLLLADVLALFIESDISPQMINGGGLVSGWLYIAAAVMQLYFDFSGYTEIVLGIGKLFGVSQPGNFNNPFMARNAFEFWQRWHMSLSEWFRVYLFSPLSRWLIKKSGRRNLLISQIIANFIVMFLIGLWHGSNYGFLVWGILQGLLLNLRVIGKQMKIRIRILENDHLARGLFFVSFLITMIFFISPDSTLIRNLLKNMSGFNGLGSWEWFSGLFSKTGMLTLLIALTVSFSGFAEAADLIPVKKRSIAVLLGILLIVSLMFLGEANNFAYIQF